MAGRHGTWTPKVPLKRDECGCHEGCTTLAHECDKKCVWPNCLTEEEHQELLAEMSADPFGDGPVPARPDGDTERPVVYLNQTWDPAMERIGTELARERLGATALDGVA